MGVDDALRRAAAAGREDDREVVGRPDTRFEPARDHVGRRGGGRAASSASHTSAERRESRMRRRIVAEVAETPARSTRARRGTRARGSSRAATRCSTTRRGAGPRARAAAAACSAARAPRRCGCAATATIAHSMPLGISSPTREPLPTPAPDEPAGERAAALVELGVGDRRVVVTSAASPAGRARATAEERRDGRALNVHEALLQRAAGRACRSTAPAARSRRARGPSRDLVGRQRARASGASARRGRPGPRRRRSRPRRSWPRSGSSSPTTWARERRRRRARPDSTSRGDTLAPAVLIMSPRRPWK